MDAYHLYQKVLSLWQQIATPTSGTSANKAFPDTPVYVRINNCTIVEVKEVTLTDNKIILEIK